MVVKAIGLIIAAAIAYNMLSDKMDLSGEDIKDIHEQSESKEPEEITTEAPDFTVKNMEGEEILLSDLKGKPVIINFWATWCGPCRSEFPHFEKCYKEYGKEINFMMVNLTDGQRDTVEGVKKFVEENEFSFPVYFDVNYEGAINYGAYSIPLTVFIDSEGNYLGKHTGAMNEETLRAYIKKL